MSLLIDTAPFAYEDQFCFYLIYYVEDRLCSLNYVQGENYLRLYFPDERHFSSKIDLWVEV